MELTTLRRLERDTLKRVTEIGEFARLGRLQEAANDAIPKINEHRGSVDVHLGFTLDIRLRSDRRRTPAPRRLDIGALIEPTADNKGIRNASYSLLMCRYADPRTSPIIRKVHFDYEPASLRQSAEPKPSYHLQICGKFSRHHLAAGYQSIRLNALYPSWEKPRIPIAPTCLAIMLNWLLLEFQEDPASQAILRAPAWRAFVAEAERTVLLQYFKDARQFLDSAAYRGKRFLQNHLYGMQID